MSVQQESPSRNRVGAGIRQRTPVIALTGFLGSGKTTVLNHLLHTPGARLGVIINDFGTINVDSALVDGQIDEAASIAGGCLCCMPDTEGLEHALTALSKPKLNLDAIIVEASGVAEPISLSRILHETISTRTRLGGLLDVIDAGEYFSTVDGQAEPPARFAASTIVAINKIDLLPEAERAARIADITARVHRRNPRAHVVACEHGALDSELLFDVARREDPADQLPLASLVRSSTRAHDHVHVDAVTVDAPHIVNPGRLLSLLENPPKGAYRIKGIVRLAMNSGQQPRATTNSHKDQRHVLNVVGHHIDINRLPNSSSRTCHNVVTDGIVVIGTDMDCTATEARVRNSLAGHNTADFAPSSIEAGLRRLERYLRS